MGKSTISMAIFNSYVKLPERKSHQVPGMVSLSKSTEKILQPVQFDMTTGTGSIFWGPESLWFLVHCKWVMRLNISEHSTGLAIIYCLWLRGSQVMGIFFQVTMVVSVQQVMELSPWLLDAKWVSTFFRSQSSNDSLWPVKSRRFHQVRWQFCHWADSRNWASWRFGCLGNAAERISSSSEFRHWWFSIEFINIFGFCWWFSIEWIKHDWTIAIRFLWGEAGKKTYENSGISWLWNVDRTNKHDCGQSWI